MSSFNMHSLISFIWMHVAFRDGLIFSHLLPLSRINSGGSGVNGAPGKRLLLPPHAQPEPCFYMQLKNKNTAISQS